jgi:hypothetical protein
MHLLAEYDDQGALLRSVRLEASALRLTRPSHRAVDLPGDIARLCRRKVHVDVRDFRGLSRPGRRQWFCPA